MLRLFANIKNAGKSAFLYNYITNALTASEGSYHYDQAWSQSRDNNISIILHTVDDQRKDVEKKLVSILASEYYDEIFINAMESPMRYKFKHLDAVLKARDLAVKQLITWAQQGKLIIKDQQLGKNLTVGQALIKNVKQRYPDKHIMYGLDNLYNLSDFGEYDDENRQAKERIDALDSVAQIEKVLIFATVEYRKGQEGRAGQRNTNQALNEMMKAAKTIEYRAKWVGHLLNEMHTDPQNAKMYFWNPDVPIDKRTTTDRFPIVSLVISKNKMTDYKGTIDYLFFPNKAVHREITPKDFNWLSNEVKQEIGHRYLTNGIVPQATTKAYELINPDKYLLKNNHEDLLSVA